MAPRCRQLAHLPDRIAAGQERPRVGAVADPLGEDLGRGVQPRHVAAAVEEPAVARVDRGAAAGGHDATQAGRRVRGPQGGHGGALAGPEARFALLVEDRRDRPAGLGRDHLVEVDQLRPVTPGEPAPGGGLAAPGEPDEHEVHGAA
jgi:hypothetical protein